MPLLRKSPSPALSPPRWGRGVLGENNTFRPMSALKAYEVLLGARGLQFMTGSAIYTSMMGRKRRSRSALVTTVTEERAMAAPARTGLSSTPKNG